MGDLLITAAEHDYHRMRASGSATTEMRNREGPREAGYQAASLGKWHMGGWQADEVDHRKLLEGGGGQGYYDSPQFRSMGGTREHIEGCADGLTTDMSIDLMARQRQSDQPFMLMGGWTSLRGMKTSAGFLPSLMRKPQQKTRWLSRNSAKLFSLANMAGTTSIG